MSHERLRPSFVFDEEKLKQLQQIVPEAFADGNINLDVLKESLGERFEEEGAEAENFGLFWPGKREARKIASIPSKGVLIPVKGEGINEETTKNIFIEGENLEVLKLLQKSYAGRIKMIYIDPPYNTGNDFIYDDNFTEPLEEYLKYTGQMDEEGKLLTTNKRADGRFHSKWLSMMYPRLRLARNLLKDEGIIFISIGDQELHNLRVIMNELFGEENFIAIISRVTKKGGNAGDFFAPSLDYVLVYAKTRDAATYFREEIGIEDMGRIYKESDDEGEFYWRNFYESALELARSRNARYYIKAPDGTKIIPPEGHRWRRIEETFLEENKNGIIKFEKDENSPHINERGRSAKWQVYYKLRPKPYVPDNIFVYLENTPNSLGTIALNKLGIDFEFSKPPQLIARLCKLCIKNEEKDNNLIVLDFFSGSGTTAHAVLEVNNEDLGNRKFICVQLPEICNKETNSKIKYRNIAEIGKERIRLAIKSIKKESAKKSNIDFGFKVLKLEKSNFKQWQDYKGKDPKELTSLFKEHEIPLIDGWKPENLLIEVMLQEGFPLDSETAELKEHKKNAVIHVKSEFCEHKLLVCFDKKIYQETINALNIQGEDIFICLDSALSDEQKITLSDKGFLKTI